MKNKNDIWVDCPDCAYKHLAAAYALLTELNPDENIASIPYVPLQSRLIARAIICLSEVLAGYEGNRSIAIGCLAVAESFVVDKDLRELRLQLLRKGAEESVREVLTHILGDSLESAMFLGHLTEARRECPSLPISVIGTDPETLAEMISDLIKDYELIKEQDHAIN